MTTTTTTTPARELRPHLPLSPHTLAAGARRRTISFLAEVQLRASFETHKNVRTTHSQRQPPTKRRRLFDLLRDDVAAAEMRDPRALTPADDAAGLNEVPPCLRYIDVQRWTEDEDEDESEGNADFARKRREVWLDYVMRSSPSRRTFMNRLKPCVERLLATRPRVPWPLPHSVAAAVYEPPKAVSELDPAVLRQREEMELARLQAQRPQRFINWHVVASNGTGTGTEPPGDRVPWSGVAPQSAEVTCAPRATAPDRREKFSRAHGHLLADPATAQKKDRRRERVLADSERAQKGPPAPISAPVFRSEESPPLPPPPLPPFAPGPVVPPAAPPEYAPPLPPEEKVPLSPG